MSFICSKCKTCGRFPFCTVTESRDDNCGEYIRRNIYQFIDDRLKDIRQQEYLESIK